MAEGCALVGVGCEVAPGLASATASSSLGESVVVAVPPVEFLLSWEGSRLEPDSRGVVGSSIGDWDSTARSPDLQGNGADAVRTAVGIN